MDTNIFLAQFWGWFNVIVAAVYLIGGKDFFNKLIKIHESRDFVFLSGWVVLPLGLATIILHNVWTADWPLIITIAGWASFFMAATRIGIPEFTQKMIKTVLKNRFWLFRTTVAIVGILGVWLIYMSL